MTRALTPTELGYIRRDGQRSRLFLAIHNPATVFSAQVNQDFSADSSKDKVVQVAYDNVTAGAFADILPGMTCWVGSTAGAYDLGKVRMRKEADATHIYPGENADVKWADNVYLTVVDEFGIWAKYPRLLADGSLFMDYDIEYDAQHSDFAPVVVMGSDAVLWLTGADVSIQFDASDSWCFSSGDKSYLWTINNGGVVADDDTATPTFTMDAAGVYRVSCTVTVGGVSSTSYRYIFVFDDANQPISSHPGDNNYGFNLAGNPNADHERGGWEFDVTLFKSSADIASVREDAKVILFSVDWYGATQTSIGAQPGRENIRCVGWIASESIVMNPVEGSVTFAVKGPHYFINALASFIDGIESNAATPTTWTSIQGLTVDKAVWHLLTWRSTVASVLDFYRSSDEHGAKALQTAQGGLLSQIRANAESVFATPRFDLYGRLFLEVESQMVTPDDRGDFPTVFEITKKDWQNAIHITRTTTPKESRVELSGVYYADGVNPLAYFSLAGGHVFKRYGEAIGVERLLLSNQADANEKAGLVLGWHNKTWDFEIQSAGNNGMVDIAPRQYLSLDIAAADTPRNIEYNGRIIVRRIVMNYDASVGFISYTWVAEQETFAENSVNGDVPPASLDVSWDTSVPFDLGMPALPALPYLYPTPTTPPSSDTPPLEVVIKASNFGVAFTKNRGVNWLFMNNGLDPSMYPDLKKIIVAPSGSIWLWIKGTSIPDGAIYRVSKIGGTWSLVARGSEILGGYIIGMGVSTDDSEKVAFMATAPDTGSWSYIGKLCIATGTTYSVAGQINVHPTDDGDIVYRDGFWYFAGEHQGLFIPPYIYKFSSSGAIVNEADIASAVGQTPSVKFLTALPSKILKRDNSGAGGIDSINPSSLVVTSRDTSITFDGNYQALAFSPTGNKALACKASFSNEAYKTTDGGTTWVGAGGTIPAGSKYWENCGDDFRWLFGGGMIARFTSDFGATYSDITGDLLTIAPLINITGIRLVSL